MHLGRILTFRNLLIRREEPERDKAVCSPKVKNIMSQRERLGSNWGILEPGTNPRQQQQMIKDLQTGYSLAFWF